jgi:hypothetical protein
MIEYNERNYEIDPFFVLENIRIFFLFQDSFRKWQTERGKVGIE